MAGPTDGLVAAPGAKDGPEWHKTACGLCYMNCGLEVQIDGRALTKIRGDKSHPKSEGYACQKAQRLTWYGDHADRLRMPLRRQPDGTYVEIEWDTALTEIAERLIAIREADAAAGRPGSFAYVGGGGQGNHSGGGYGTALMRWMRSTRSFNALSQEKTGDFWVNGHMFGAQTCHTAEDIEDSDLLVVLGCNPWLAHGFNRARNTLNQIKTNPDRKLLVLDPRRTETAAIADVHLALRPGTDAYLLSAILALVLERGGQDDAFLAEHTTGFETVAAVLRAVPVDEWIHHAEVEREDVDRAVDLILASQRMVVRAELGIQQGRNSTLNSYLEKLLFLLTGNFGRPGTNGLHSWLVPLWVNSQGERSEITGFEYIAGLLPTNTLVEEIVTDHPNRIRALWIESSNPANTYTDTVAVEQAILDTELSVVVDVAFTESAALADYVLPAATQIEKYEFTLFNWEWPTNYFHIRRPLLEPLGDSLPEPEIYARLFEALGAMPADEELAEIVEVAEHDRAAALPRLGAMMRADPDLAAVAPVLLYRTVGKVLPDGSAAVAPVWAGCHRAAMTMPRPIQRALNTSVEGPVLGELLFDTILESASGAAFSQHEYQEIWELVRHDRVHLVVPEMLEWIGRLDADSDRRDDLEYPFSLINGQRRSHNANQILRPPAWRKTDPEGALRIRTDDLACVGVEPGGWVAVVTRIGRLVARAEIDDSLRSGQVALPHGFGMVVSDGHGGRVLNGPRINLITDALDRDPIAGTPHHKDMPVRLEAATPAEVSENEAASEVVLTLAGKR
ncbi:molybdopterin-dependent oxidoreductase [Nocardioides endophyticus]|uniref:Molybdopterin-dependent oxidoreductase n=2 Tax=Nocardioides endophyticus TaxID=1353775 RepID=A0ABP8ZCQ5_9ACTN